MSDYCQPANVNAHKIGDNADATEMVRLFVVQSGERWGLQLRGPLATRTRRPKQTAIFAHASLNRLELEALSGAILDALAAAK